MAEPDEAPLLSTCQLAALRAVGAQRRFAPGERLVSIGAEATEVFYLLDGLVKVVVTSPNGDESVFALRPPGVFVGEMSTLNARRRSADIIAVEPTSTVVVSEAHFTRYLHDHPDVALALLRMLSLRLDEMTRRSMLGSLSVKARVAQRLVELSSRNAAESKPADGPHGILVSITQSVLAQWVDASREWTSKALGELQTEGSIQTSRGRILVIDREALRATANP